VYDGDMERARNCIQSHVFAREIYNVENGAMLSVRGCIADLAVTLTMCAASHSRPMTPWRVEIATSGGLAGRGVGTFAIASDGTVSVRTMTGKSCSYRATEEEIQRFEELLTAATPEKWSASYAPENRCCDRIEYTLTFDEADRRFTTEWIDGPLPMPEDLVALSAAIAGGSESSLRRHYGEQCR
jgi:hypothetical protein